MLENIIETVEFNSSATTLINQKLKQGWVILDTFQFKCEEEGEAGGLALMGLPKKPV